MRIRTCFTKLNASWNRSLVEVRLGFAPSLGIAFPVVRVRGYGLGIAMARDGRVAVLEKIQDGDQGALST